MEHCAYPDERVAHGDVEFFQIVFGKESRVGVVEPREGVEVDFLNFHGVRLGVVFDKTLVAFENLLLCLGELFLESLGRGLLFGVKLGDFRLRSLRGFRRARVFGRRFRRRFLRAARLFGGLGSFALFRIGRLLRLPVKLVGIAKHLVYDVVDEAFFPKSVGRLHVGRPVLLASVGTESFV